MFSPRTENTGGGRWNWERVTQSLNGIPPEYQTATAFASGVLVTSGVTIVYRRYFRRIPNSDWITPNIVKRKRFIKGKVTSVGDNDNFRLYHTPGLGWSWPLKFRRVPSTSKQLRDRTIHIRLAGVDAPEASHFGRPAQQFSAESLAWLKSQVEGKIVYCQIFRKDQYSRIIAMPYLKPRLLPGWLAKGKCIPVEMLKAGWAVTYEQAGAEYGQWSKEDFLQMQSEAQAAKRGIWKYGNLKETPAEYKRRYASGVEQAEAAIEPSSPVSSKPPLWRRLIGLR